MKARIGLVAAAAVAATTGLAEAQGVTVFGDARLGLGYNVPEGPGPAGGGSLEGTSASGSSLAGGAGGKTGAVGGGLVGSSARTALGNLPNERAAGAAAGRRGRSD